MNIIEELKALREDIETARTTLSRIQNRMVRIMELVEELDPKGEK